MTNAHNVDTASWEYCVSRIIKSFHYLGCRGKRVTCPGKLSDWPWPFLSYLLDAQWNAGTARPFRWLTCTGRSPGERVAAGSRDVETAGRPCKREVLVATPECGEPRDARTCGVFLEENQDF